MEERVKVYRPLPAHEETFAALCEAAGLVGRLATRGGNAKTQAGRTLSIARGRRCPIRPASRRRSSSGYWRRTGSRAGGRVSGWPSVAPPMRLGVRISKGTSRSARIAAIPSRSWMASAATYFGATGYRGRSRRRCSEASNWRSGSLGCLRRFARTKLRQAQTDVGAHRSRLRARRRRAPSAARPSARANRSAATNERRRCITPMCTHAGPAAGRARA